MAEEEFKRYVIDAPCDLFEQDIDSNGDRNANDNADQSLPQASVDPL